MNIVGFLVYLLTALALLLMILAMLLTSNYLRNKLSEQQLNLFRICVEFVTLFTLTIGAFGVFYFAHLSYTDPLGYETLFAIGILTFILIVEVIRYRKKFGKSKDRKEGVKNVSGLSDK